MKSLSLSIVVFLLLLPALGCSGALAGQVVERERQVELAPERGVVEISPELRARLGLFPETTDFRAARLWLRDDRTAVLEIESLRDGALHRERRLLAEVELQAFRDRLSELLDEQDVRVLGTQEGRGGLVVGHTLLGLGFHGWAVPVTLGVSSAQAGVASYLLTAGAAFYVPYRLTRDRTVSDTHRNLSMYGGTRGVLTGVLLGGLLASDATLRVNDDRERLRLGGGVAGGVAGGIAGFHAVDRWLPDPGTGALWGALGDAGLAAGAALAYVAGPYAEEEVIRGEDGFEWIERRRRSRRAGHAITVAGQAAGLTAGAWLGHRRTHSEGDVAALRSSMILGAQLGATATRGVGVEEGRGIAAGALAGGLGGTALGDRLLAPRNLTRGEGLLVNAGHLAGGAVALGVTYLIVDDLDDRELLYLSTSTAGSILGAGFVWRSVASDAEARRGGGAGHEHARGKGPELRLDLPAAVMAFTGSDGTGPVLPLLTIRY